MGLEALEQFGSSVTVLRDEELCAPGDAADSCWRVVSGCVRRFEVLDDGRRHVNAFLLPGDFFGFDDPEKQVFGAEAVITTTLRRYPRSAVAALAESNVAISQHLAALTIANLHAAYQRMVLLGRRTSSERLASFVLEMARRLGSAAVASVDLPMGREDIADYLGLTKETVCRVLTEMGRSGVVRLTRTGIEILMRQELVARSGGGGIEKAKQICLQVWRPREARRSAA
jgi:CRP/FNR family nitrogen fixation transcriptional regulator